MGMEAKQLMVVLPDIVKNITEGKLLFAANWTKPQKTRAAFITDKIRIENGDARKRRGTKRMGELSLVGCHI
jgi:hypothetical protein